jgi:hypothetical protein
LKLERKVFLLQRLALSFVHFVFLCVYIWRARRAELVSKEPMEEEEETRKEERRKEERRGSLLQSPVRQGALPARLQVLPRSEVDRHRGGGHMGIGSEEDEDITG